MLGPEAEAPGRLTTWWLGVALVGALANLPQTTPLFLGLRGLSALVGMVGLAVLAQWAERYWFFVCSRRGLLARVVLGAATPWGAFFGFVIVMALAGRVAGDTNVHVQGNALTTPLLFFTVSFASASVGSTGILLIDRVISRLVQGYRARVTLAVLALLTVSAAANVSVMMLALSFVSVLSRDLKASGKLDFEGVGQYSAEEVQQWVLAHPATTGLVLFALSLIIILPMTVSAALHLAESVSERLRPLAKALRRVGSGDRDVRVEEAGSRDFVAVNRGFNEMVDSLARSERMERAFGVYVSSQVLSRIRAQHGEAVIPPSLHDASVFFADIRGFTSMSERLPPEAVVGLLNRYFTHVVRIVDAHEGYLNKFIGDAVVVVFNGPVDQADHAARALECALALQREVQALNAQGAFPEAGTLNIGIGVATGPMVCGNIGGSTQMEYTVIGDTVNLSARLTSHAGAGEVWASEATVAKLPPGLNAEQLPPLKVKGKEQLVVPSRVTRAGGAPSAARPASP